MPMVRAMRLLNAIEAGTTTGAQLQTLLAADPGRLAELNVLLGMRGQARRMAASSTAMTAMIASSTALAAMVANRVSMIAVSESAIARSAMIGSSPAMTALNSNDQAVRMWMLAGTGLSYANYWDVAAVVASTAAMTAIAASSAAMANVAASTAATTAIKNNAAANNIALGSSYSVGAYIDRIRIIGGDATNATLAGLATMTAVVASAAAKMAMFSSDTALNAIAASATAITAIRAAAGYSVLATDNTSGSRPWPGVAGGKYIIAGISTSDSSTGATITVSTLRAGSTRPNTHLTDASSVSLATALGAILCPCEEAFTVATTDGGIQILYLGALRCDV